MGNESPTLTTDGKQPIPPTGWCAKRTGPGLESPRQGLTASLCPCDLGQVTSYFWLPQSCLQSEMLHPCQLRGWPASSARLCVEAPVHTRGAVHGGISTVLFTSRISPISSTCLHLYPWHFCHSTLALSKLEPPLRWKVSVSSINLNIIQVNICCFLAAARKLIIPESMIWNQ